LLSPTEIAMRLLLSACAAVVLAAQALPGAAADASCEAALAAVSEEWRAAAYEPPMKPAQAYVIGRDGRHPSGRQVTYMRAELKLAAHECSAGDNRGALQHIAIVHRLLSD
jgi:hypothetical protein